MPFRWRGNLGLAVWRRWTVRWWSQKELHCAGAGERDVGAHPSVPEAIRKGEPPWSGRAMMGVTAQSAWEAMRTIHTLPLMTVPFEEVVVDIG